MSRTFWVAVGAVGGVYAYRRGQRAAAEARERGLVGNVQAAAGAAVSIANGTSKLVALAGQGSGYGQALDAQVDPAVERVQVMPVRRTPLSRQDTRVPSTAMKLEALNPESVVDVRNISSRATG